MNSMSTSSMSIPLLLRFTLILAVLAWPSSSPAGQGDPVAVRVWPNGHISVETQWNFTIALRTRERTELPTELNTADLVLECPSSKPIWHVTWYSEPGLASSAKSVQIDAKQLDHYLDRLPNTAEQTFAASSEATFVSKNAVSLAQCADHLLMLSVDGMRIAIPLSGEFAAPATPLAFDAVVLLTHSHESPQAQAAYARRVGELQTRYVLLGQTDDARTLALGREPEVEMQNGNTFALRSQTPQEQAPVESASVESASVESASAESEDSKTSVPRWIGLSQIPWQMPQELSQLFAEKERACSESQQTFAKLSVAQMNFKPANGTHTPRWNAEHMLGRELGFFSQIYAQCSSEISHMDLNPQQMPPDYTARHADWDGREEARQMQRVSAFTRRYAYLLDGLDLDQPAPGSRWTLRKLLKQMDVHYREHTANVNKKFELPDWPKE